MSEKNLQTEIPMVTVKSSQIDSIGYYNEKQELYIEFNSGVVYKYLNVPKSIFNRLIGPLGKVGEYFHSDVRGRYAYEKTDLHLNGQTLQLK